MKRKVNKKNKKIDRETAMVLILSAFTTGMLLEKIILCGTSWLSTIGYFW